MTKRFKLVEYLPNVIRIKDNNQKLNSYEIVDLMNELHEEKEISIEGIRIANDLIMKYGSEELKHEWQKNVRVKEYDC